MNATPLLRPVLPHTAPAPAVTSAVAARLHDDRFADLGHARRIWAIGAVNGDANKIANLHDMIVPLVRAGDRVVYLGNYLGATSASHNALDEIIATRRYLLAIPGMQPTDLIYLRGMVEEMWHKLLQLQFCQDPAPVLDYMEAHGMGEVLAAYGSSVAEARIYLRDRPIGLTKWTNRLRAARRAAPAHEVFSTVLKRAAFGRAANGAPGPILFVHAGLDPRLPLSQQNDQFWFGWQRLTKHATTPYHPFTRIVRGYNPAGGAQLAGNLFTLAAPAQIHAACFDPRGQMIESYVV